MYLSYTKSYALVQIKKRVKYSYFKVKAKELIVL